MDAVIDHQTSAVKTGPSGFGKRLQIGTNACLLLGSALIAQCCRFRTQVEEIGKQCCDAG